MFLAHASREETKALSISVMVKRFCEDTLTMLPCSRYLRVLSERLSFGIWTRASMPIALVNDAVLV